MFLARIFPVFLLACSRGVSVYVEPPINVTFTCRNMCNIVKWSYGEMQPGLRFKVNISSKFSTTAFWVDPPILQADVSSMSDPSEDYIFDVSAVLGVTESDKAPPDGITYSYFMRSLAERKCVVDFPPVSITAEDDDHIQFHFKHPRLYHERWPIGKTDNSQGTKKERPILKKDMPEFKYEVKVAPQSNTQSFTCRTSLCSGRLAVDSAQEICLEVNGEMDKVSVVGKPLSCAARPTKWPYEKNKYIAIAIPVVSVIILGGLALLFFMVYRKKTHPFTALPRNLTSPEPTGPLTLNVTRETVSTPHVDANSPTPLLNGEEEITETMSIVPSSTDKVIRLPIGLPSEDRAVSEEAQVEAENDEGCNYIQGNDLEEDETQPCSSGESSGYEKRCVVVTLGLDDEQAEGYRY